MLRPRTTWTFAVGFVALLTRCAPEETAEEGPKTDAPNVLLITLDTTRADRLGCYGHAGAVTPTLDRLAAEGVLFERALTVSPVTLPAHTSILTGQYPIEHGVHDNGIFSAEASLDSLAEILSSQGFATAGFVSSAILAETYGLHQGFDTFDDEMTTAGGRELGHLERRAAQTVNAALGWIEDAPPEPWFVWMHFYDPHLPYQAPESLEFGVEDAYDAEVAYVDAQLTRFLRKYDVEGRLDRTLTVITADHGEGLGEHGEETHGLFMYDTTMWVPLIVRSGRWQGGRRIGGQVSVVDLVPTLLDALQIPLPAKVDGESFLSVLQGEQQEVWHDAYLENQMPYHYMGMAAVDGFSSRRYKYVHSPQPELYDLGADPRERTNVLDRGDLSPDELLARLEALRAGRDPLEAGPNRSLDADDRVRLAMLGYVLESEPRGNNGRDPKDYLRVLELRNEIRGASEEKDFDRALELLREALEICPGDATSHGMLGQVYLFKGDVAAAIPHLERCLSLRPDLGGNVQNLARAHQSMGNKEEALRCYEVLIAYSPSQVASHLEAARLCLELGKRERAASLVEAVRKMNEIKPKERAELELLLKALSS